MENFEFKRTPKLEPANDNIESPEKNLERIKTALRTSFQESQRNGGVAKLGDNDLKTEYQDCLRENSDLLTKELASMQMSTDLFEQQLYKMASEVADKPEVQSKRAA